LRKYAYSDYPAWFGLCSAAPKAKEDWKLEELKAGKENGKVQ
jgi:hypothetical protein